MVWGKRESVSDLVVLGDDEGNIRRVAGLLAAVTQDRTYPSRMNYELVQKNGDSINLAGSASLGRQIGPADVGKFLKAEFVGWGKSANGKFKEITVHVWDDEPTAEMKQWPRWAELNGKNGAKALTHKPSDDLDDFPEALDAEDDNLPF